MKFWLKDSVVASSLTIIAKSTTLAVYNVPSTAVVIAECGEGWDYPSYTPHILPPPTPITSYHPSEIILWKMVLTI